MTTEVTADLKSIVDGLNERKRSDEEALFVAKVELEILTQQQQAKRQEVKQIEDRLKSSEKQLRRVEGFLGKSGVASAGAADRPRRGRPPGSGKAAARKGPKAGSGKRGRPRKSAAKVAGAARAVSKKAAARKAATGVGRGRGRRRTGGPPTVELVLQVLRGAPEGLVTKDLVGGVNRIDASRTYSNVTAQVSNLKKAGRVVQDGAGRYKLAS